MFQLAEEVVGGGEMEHAVLEACWGGSPIAAALQSVWLQPPLPIHVKTDAARDRPANGIWCWD